MATPRYASPTNVLPVATGQVIGYIRDPREFAVNRYTQLIEAPVNNFTWFELERDQAVRVVREQEFAWEDGDERPTGHHNLTRFSQQTARTFRRDFPWMLGWQTIQTHKKAGAFDPAEVEAKSVASQAMTFRTNRVINLLDTAANWTVNTDDANTLNGGVGKWDKASDDETVTGHYLAIKKSLFAAAQKIHLATNGKVKIKDMQLIVNPVSAQAMANTSEIHNYIKYLASVKVLTEGGLDNPNEMWGLPAKLYGFEVVVEDAPIVTVYPKADGTIASIASNERTYIKNSDSAIITSRPGAIDAPYGAPSFSTMQLYWYDAEMKVESFSDSKNQRDEGHVVEQIKEVLAAEPTGYLITDILT